MADSIYDSLKGILGDDAEEKINSALASLGASENASASAPMLDPKNMEYIMKIRGVLDELERTGDDNRSRLLTSLKPYMHGRRQQSIDSAIKLLNLTKLSSIFRM